MLATHDRTPSLSERCRHQRKLGRGRWTNSTASNTNGYRSGPPFSSDESEPSAVGVPTSVLLAFFADDLAPYGFRNFDHTQPAQLSSRSPTRRVDKEYPRPRQHDQQTADMLTGRRGDGGQAAQLPTRRACRPRGKDGAPIP